MFNIFISSLWCQGIGAVFSSATQQAMAPEFVEKGLGSGSVLTLGLTLPLPTLLHAGYSVKLKKKNYNI